MDAAAVPMSVFESKFANVGQSDGVRIIPNSGPVQMYAAHAEERLRDGALGTALVYSMELQGDDNRPPEKAFIEVRLHSYLVKFC